jgi:capsular polysaccharide biosynthesis protein
MTRDAFDQGLRVDKARNVLAIPQGAKGGQGGLIANDVPLTSLLLHRGGRQVFSSPEPCPATVFIDEPCIFAGWILRHYGHFLLEGLSRLWYLKQHPDAKIVWVNRGGRVKYTGVQAQLLDLLGVRNEPIFTVGPTHFARLEIPSPGYEIPHVFEVEQAHALAVWPAAKKVSGKRVWLSRSHLEERGGFENELEAEAVLEQRGWLIYHPQEHSIRDQLAMFADAEHVAGIEGSAFHTLILIDRPPAKLSILSRRAALSPNLKTIAKVKHLNQQHVAVPMELREGEDDGPQRPEGLRLRETKKRNALQRARWLTAQSVADALDARL